MCNPWCNEKFHLRKLPSMLRVIIKEVLTWSMLRVQIFGRWEKLVGTYEPYPTRFPLFGQVCPYSH